MLWRTVQDSNPRLRLRKPEGYPNYPNGPDCDESPPVFNPPDGRQQPFSLGYGGP